MAGHESERVFSVEKVGDEVLAVGDELSGWAEARGNGFFLRPDASVFPALAAVSAWANSQAYEPAAVNTFLQVADYYLVAQALAGRHTVVTHEVPSASPPQDQDSGCLHRPRHQVHDAFRNVAPRTSAVCPRGSLMSDQTGERAFETHVEETLLRASGWQRDDNAEWDVERALFPVQVCGFLEATQPRLWSDMRTLHGDEAGGAAARFTGQGARPQGHAACVATRLQVLRQDLPARDVQAGAWSQ